MIFPFINALSNKSFTYPFPRGFTQTAVNPKLEALNYPTLRGFYLHSVNRYTCAGQVVFPPASPRLRGKRSDIID